jgi:predicted AlkP superfamily phosphohydrolase/phosphomutase
MLTLAEYPERPTPKDRWCISWDRTDAWGEGGYYGRVFLNVAGREPDGRIPAAALEPTRAALMEALAAIPDDRGRPLETRVLLPEELYRAVQRVAPDLLVYFDDLRWRSVGSVGHRSLWTFENDTGPDDANHAQHGIFIYRDPRASGGDRRLPDRSIYDMAPTLMALLGLDAPADLRGRAMTDLPGVAV